MRGISLSRFLFLALGLCSAVGFFAPMAQATGKTIVLCTTFPIYQITRNVAQGSTSLEVVLMLPAQLGCPHDYVLTPQDMQKLAKADILVINGLGMDESLDTPFKKANPGLQTLDSSSGIGEILPYTSEGEYDHPDHETSYKHQAHIAGDTHIPAKANPHLFASPRMAAKLALNIAHGLNRIDPAGKDLYERNARVYAARLNALADELVALGRTLANNRIVTQHGVFDYLARDMGLSVVAVVAAHAGQDPSAAQTLALVRTIKRTRAGAVLTEPQYPDRVAHMIAREAGVKAAVLDPVASGPANAGLDYYEKVMRRNMTTLKETLGTR